MLRTLFEHTLRSRWKGPEILVRYWDGREFRVGAPPAVVTVTMRSPTVLREALLSGSSLALGHAYTDGRLGIDGDLQALLRAVAQLSGGETGKKSGARRWLRAMVTQNTPRRAVANARFHYDMGNAFFRLWLDPSLTYSCAYFNTEHDDIAKAQEQKRERICQKLELEEGQTLLDVGCGWGSLLFHAIERYGVSGVGVTPSREQARYVGEEAKRRGVSDQLTLHLADWRTVRGAYDRVVSVGMYEHVGWTHGREFFQAWQSWLKPRGVSVLHTIGSMVGISVDPWLGENILPGAYLPSLSELAAHAAASNLIVTDVENLWRHYALTLAAWSKNFSAAREQILRMTDEEFVRTWWLYLNAAEASFRAGRTLLWQIVLTNGKRPQQQLTRDRWVLGP